MISTVKKLCIVLACFLIIITPQTLQSQDIKYDDIIEDMHNMNPNQRYSRFFQYQNQDPHFANTYIQLGDACEKIFRNLDPLREYEQVEFWAKNAILYYGLFPVYIKSREVRKERDYYNNFDIKTENRRFDDEDVIRYTKQRIEYCNNYRDSVKLIYLALEKSKDHYNNCVRIFNEINQKYDNLNESLLQTNDEFLEIVDELNAEYNATMEQFDQYKKLIEQFPLGNYNQEFELAPILTFRLDGLTNSNFLDNKFTIWNYGQWVKDFKETYNTDITSIRKEINSIQRVFNNNKRRLSLIPSVSEEEEFESFDNLFLYRLGKYDSNSLVRELFIYLNARQNYLVARKLPVALPSDSSSELMNRKLRYYHSLVGQKMQSEIKLTEFKNAISPERIIRFTDFFQQQYQGHNGLIKFHDDQQQYLSQTLEESFGNLKTYFHNEEAYRELLGSASGSRGAQVPLSPVDSVMLSAGNITYVTQNTTYVQGEPLYASGYINRRGSKPLAFIAKIKQTDDENTIGWIREVGAKGRQALPNGDQAKIHHGYADGCATVVSGQNNNHFENILVQLDETGKEVFSKKLENPGQPIFLSYDDITKQFMLAFKETPPDTAEHAPAITFYQADSLGNTTWEMVYSINGEIVDIVKSGESYLAVVNYKENKGNDDNSDSEKWSAQIINLSNDGKIRDTYSFPSTNSYHINRVFIVSREELNLIGYEGEPDSKDDNLKYILTSPNGNVTFSNLK
ncbi:MAG: hypothetical protein ACLFNU_05570 [Bacteroidales bacterium]